MALEHDQIEQDQIEQAQRISDVVTREQSRLRNFIRRRVPDPRDAEDILQDVFYEFVEANRLLMPIEHVTAWLFRVARNLALKQRTANQLRLRRIVEFNETLPEQHVDRNPNPEERLQSRQRQTRLLAVMRALPEQDRCCLYLRAEGLRYREIAATLGISLGAVSIALTRSLARMGRVVEG